MLPQKEENRQKSAVIWHNGILKLDQYESVYERFDTQAKEKLCIYRIKH